MGFKAIKNKVIDAVKNGRTQSTPRADKGEKNLFLTGEINSEQLVQMLGKTKGTQYSVIPHKDDANVEVHIFKPLLGDEEWYIKFYVIDPDCIFISVHFSKKILRKTR